ncbi:acetyl-CoA carboxylase biotin carboxylase subunit [Roseovarius faecimaris]|uniref:biotin carboxylase n=1 Tax=Roseovarius faecimaris TaxID=2494550 RepID=A0A6I6IJE1_9RHOB|nr:acetyl-CoA carboxylase biotin carboxylase subunit [Roseovarius faecimaris]QGX97070.1 acetyl-CoA carboxylase biotin carboxylase subunit [Roseovarius faecimaris]
MPIRSLFIANRGEIAVRIIRAARELGIETIQAYSDADESSLAVQIADRAVNVGPPHATKSYLRVDGMVQAARDAGADAVHPGYGFLAENAEFADAVVAAGMTFVGPDGDMIRMMGDKVSARQAAIRAGVPVVPGSEGRIDDPDAARALAEEIGFPVMIKAAAGGGGRGIRIADDMAAFEAELPKARAEAEAAFGDGGLYIEKVIGQARHIEVQVLGDGENVVHCYERECSLQRRRQKVWEEAPAACLNDAVRAKLCDSAVALAKAVNYQGAGTVEYLYDDATEEFYFIEMNTRIQVEHPCSEWITGLDLVAEMIRIAGGGKLRHAQSDIEARGHAIEVRLNAEDPANNFMPFPGLVGDLRLPGGPGVRFDSMLYSGYAIPPFYDSLLGKLIVWAETRDEAITRLDSALSELTIEGVKTTAPLFRALAADATVREGDFHTKWLEGWLTDNAARLT